MLLRIVIKSKEIESSGENVKYPNSEYMRNDHG
jgi:hypothetical protein